MKKILFLIIFPFAYSYAFTQKLDLKETFQQHKEFNNRYYNIHFVNKDTFMIKAGWFNSIDDYTQLQISYNKGHDFFGKKGPNGYWGVWIGTSIYINYGGTKWGLQMSTDTGATSDSVTTGPFIAKNISSPSSYKNAVFISFDWETYVSYDTLKTWTKCDAPTYFAGNKWLYASDSSLIVLKSGGSGTPLTKLESKDFGLTWTLSKLSAVPESYSYTLGFLDPNTCYFTDIKKQSLFWSFDGGLSNSVSYVIDIPNYEFNNVISFANRRIGYMVVNGFDLYKTFDSGKSWHLKHTFPSTELIKEIKVFDSLNVYFLSYGTTQDHVIYYTENGLETIVNVNEPETLNFTLYPNPASQSITLSTPNGANAALSIYNLMGQKQYQNTNQAPGNIDISHLATGLYIFELRQGSAVHRQRIEVVK